MEVYMLHTFLPLLVICTREARLSEIRSIASGAIPGYVLSHWYYSMIHNNTPWSSAGCPNTRNAQQHTHRRLYTHSLTPHKHTARFMNECAWPSYNERPSPSRASSRCSREQRTRVINSATPPNVILVHVPNSSLDGRGRGGGGCRLSIASCEL